MPFSDATLKDLANDPILGLEGEMLKEYLSTAQVGDEMMLYNSHHSMHTYQLVTITDLDVGPQKRVIVSRSGYSGGRSFYRSGKNAFSPKGQTRLIPVIPVIREMIGDRARQEISFGFRFETKV